MEKLPKKMLITGASGFLGYTMCSDLRDRYEITGTYASHAFTLPGCSITKLDITDHNAVKETVNDLAPDIIVHAAAVSKPDTCEKHPETAKNINLNGTKYLAEAAHTIGARIAYVSTDMVFDGNQGMYTEADPPNPLNYYGQTKLDAERACLAHCPNSTVVRITLQYGMSNEFSSCFTDWIISNLRQANHINLFIDQYRTPTYVHDTVKGLERAALHAHPGTTFHLAAPDRIDRYTFARHLIAQFGFPEHLLVKKLMDDVPSSAPRPKDVSLDGGLFKKTFNFQPRGVINGLSALASEMRT